MRLYSYIKMLYQSIYREALLQDLKLAGCSIGQGVKVYGRFSWVGRGRNLAIGSYTTINEGVFLNARDILTIGERVHLSPYAQLHTGRLDLGDRSRRHISAPITIGNSVWIASGSIIAGGVTIGDNSVIGANSLVLDNVPENVLVGGVPAKLIRILDDIH